MISYSGEDFWIAAESNQLSGTLQYTGEYYISYFDKSTGKRVESSSIETLSKSTNPEIVGSTEVGTKVSLSIDISNIKATSFIIMPILKVLIVDYINFELNDAPIISVSSEDIIAKAEITGSLKIAQNRAYPYLSTVSDLTSVAILNKMSTPFDISAYSNLKRFADESLEASYQSTIVTGTTGSSITIDLDLGNSITVIVEPGLWQSFKVRFVQFIYYLIVFVAVSRMILHKAFESKMVHIHRISDLPSSCLKDK